MQTWIKIIPVEETLESKEYFIGRECRDYCDFYCRNKAGKNVWAGKPGIALHFAGGPKMVSDFTKNPHVNLVAIEIPADADRRWSRRR